MKTKTIATLLLGIVASLCLATQCEKEEFTDELPPETQTGANTFGCLVNGELFVKARGNLMGNKPLSANYHVEPNSLHIHCASPAPAFKFIDLYIYSPILEGENILFRGYLTTREGAMYYGFGCEDCGSVFITRFDTINRIVSGTFEFSGKCVSDTHPSRPMKYVGDSTVQITNGRFDIKY